MNNREKKTVEEVVGSLVERADLRGADLREADLEGAKLLGADLRGADLEGVDLREADLRGADLEGVDLREADLRGADLEGANIDFSSLPLQCGGLNWKVDKRIMAQIAYHICSMDVMGDEELLEYQRRLLPLADQFHRIGADGLVPIVK